MNELKAGSTLGRNELLVRIGRGGMASVWVARQRSPTGKQRFVAVKAMLPELAQESDFRSMFLEEGQIVGSIDHKNVVRVYEVAEDRGILYMAMEWVEGDTLHMLIKEANKRRPVPTEIAVRAIADTAAGLHAAHELHGWDGELRGLVHCDVSPHNILIGLDGEAKLVDFGVANAMAQRDLQQSSGELKGKFGYMSPEQARTRPLDRRSDVFSLGIVLFELTTGERLFKGRDKRHTLELVAFGDIPRPSELNPKVLPELEAIILRALARDLEERFQTADEMRLALERFLIDQRMLVSKSSVVRLLKRVLGAHIEQRREAIRASLTALDGSHEALRRASLPGFDLAQTDVSSISSNTSRSSLSLASPTRPSNDSWRLQSDAPGSSSSTSNTGAASPQTLGKRPSSRSPLVFGFGAAIALLAGAVAVAWALQQRAKPIDDSFAENGPISHVIAPARSSGRTGPDQGVSIDSLPMAQEQAAQREREAHGKTPKPESKPPKAPQVAQTETEKAPPSVAIDKGPGLKLEESPESETAETTPEEAPPSEPKVELPKAKKEPLPPNASRPPLNRGAAIAALGAAASSASSCKRPGGPTGPGRATVTFSPDGPAASVAISGKFNGTPVGSCLATLFRRAHVPAFSGSAITLGTSFRVPE